VKEDRFPTPNGTDVKKRRCFMAKKIVKNACNQPLYLNLARGRAVKIRARGTAEIEEADLQSPEMIVHRNRGNVVVLEKKAEQEVTESAKAEAEKKAKREIPESAEAEPEKKVKSTNKVK
jgi:hypothetical protein